MKLFLSLLFILVSFTSYAESNYEVAFFEAGLLYHNNTGIDKDIINEISKRTNIKFSHTEKPRARIWREMLDGRLAITMAGIPSPERNKAAWFYQYAAQRNHAIFLKGKEKNYSSFEDFAKNPETRIAVVRGFNHGPFYDKIIAKLKKTKRVDEVAQMDTLFMMLKKNERIDLILSSPVFYALHLKNFELEDGVVIKNWDRAREPNPASIVLSKKLVSETDRRKIEVALEEIKNDGTLKKIIRKYMSEKETLNALSF